MRTLPFLAAVALSLAAMPALAKNDRKVGFDEYDRNNDGVITKAEAVGHPRLTKRFNAIDRNDDGRITRGEWVARNKKAKPVAKERSSQDRRFSALDRNDDGVLSRSEARGHLDRSPSTGR